MNRKNITLAVTVAADAIHPNPNNAAIKAITKNVIVQRIIDLIIFWRLQEVPVILSRLYLIARYGDIYPVV
jgi:hypothetical protein